MTPPGSTARLPVFALCDANSFYASCEQLFDPHLRGRPVVVLSNGDGCVVARSAEAKTLGIRMGVPWFELRELAERHQVHACSSNYALYASMSNRVVSVLRQFSDELEVYSIDESFLRLDSFAGRQERDTGFYAEYARQIMDRVLLWTGLPTCVGIGHTKTLAKLANHVAKKVPDYCGVCCFVGMEEAALTALMASLPVQEVWGIGSRLTAQLEQEGIRSVLDLRQASAEWARDRFSVVVERTVRELNGVSCLPLELTPPAKQQIISSRSFGSKVYTLQELQDAVVFYVSTAAEKLRAQGSTAATLTVFIASSRFTLDEPRYARSLILGLPEATSDTRLLCAAGLMLLAKMFRPGVAYKKAGVILGGIQVAERRQASLFAGVGLADDAAVERSAKLMAAMDGLNRKYGRGTVAIRGVAGEGRAWSNRRDKLSPAYTTRWADLPVAYAREDAPLAQEKVSTT